MTRGTRPPLRKLDPWGSLVQAPITPSPSQMSPEPSIFSWNMRQVHHANSKNRATGKEGTLLAVACPCPQTAPGEVSTLSGGYLKDNEDTQESRNLGQRPIRSFLVQLSQIYTYPSCPVCGAPLQDSHPLDY